MKLVTQGHSMHVTEEQMNKILSAYDSGQKRFRVNGNVLMRGSITNAVFLKDEVKSEHEKKQIERDMREKEKQYKLCISAESKREFKNYNKDFAKYLEGKKNFSKSLTTQ